MKQFTLTIRLALAVQCLVLLLTAGCQGPQQETAQLKPVFYPEPPDEARLQFLTSISALEDIGAGKASAFDKFMWGQPERRNIIVEPYGVAMHDGRMYVCDVATRMIEVFDIANKKMYVLSQDRRMRSPRNIFIDNGFKYVADPDAGAVFVFDEEDDLARIVGKELDIAPMDVAVFKDRCYVADRTSNSVVVMDAQSGQEILRMGTEGDGPGQFLIISDLTIDGKGHVFVTDKAMGRITEFDSQGIFQRTIGQRGDNIDELIRPKGIAVDHMQNIWLVDTAVEIVKIYDNQGRLLLFFGFPGRDRGNMNMPAKVILDYENVDLFADYAVEGAEIEFLVIVSNQYGLNKINVYGFGSFPQSGE